MTSPLENLSGPGKALAAEPPDATETDGLLRSGRARLTDVVAACETVAAKIDVLGKDNP